MIAFRSDHHRRCAGSKTGTLLVLSTLAFGCGDTAEPGDRDDIQGIIDGQLEQGHPSVGLVGALDTPIRNCSGTLVDPSWIVTARHCSSLRGFYTGTDASNFEYHPVTDRVYYPDTSADMIMLRLREPIHDLPVVKLARALPRVGEECTAVGFGNNDAAKRGIKRSGKLRVLSADRSSIVAGGGLSLEGGDSGGPLLCCGKVVGVASLGSGKYATLDSAWVKRTIANPASTRSAVVDVRSNPPPVAAVRLVGYSGELCPAGSLSIEEGVVHGERQEPSIDERKKTCTIQLSVAVPAGKRFNPASFYLNLATELDELPITFSASIAGKSPIAETRTFDPSGSTQKYDMGLNGSACGASSGSIELPLTLELSTLMPAGETLNRLVIKAPLDGKAGTIWWDCPTSAKEESL